MHFFSYKNLTQSALFLEYINAPPVRYLEYTKLMRQGSITNTLGWQGNVDDRKSDLDYATLGHAFRIFFLYKIFSCVFINTMIVKTISS